MAGRHFHLSTGNTFLTWLIAAIVVLLLPAKVTDRFQLSFQKTFMPILELGRKAQLSATHESPGAGEISLQEHQKLWKDYQNLYGQAVQLHTDYQALAQIRSNLPTPFDENLVLARVTSSVNSFTHEIIINQGSEAGIQTGQYVLSAGQNSVIGIIEETRPTLSKVLLLTDSQQKIPVDILHQGQASGIGGLMVGNGKNACHIANIETSRKVEIGDAVFARAHPGLLNTPVIIGTVTDVRPDEKHPLLWDITVEPVEDMARLNDVAVIVVEDF